MILALVLLAGLSRAPPTLSSDDLAFGLAKLKWGMSPPEARGQLPKLDGVRAEPGQPASELTLHDYPVLGCHFTVMLTFESGRLAQVDLDSIGTAHLAACDAKIRAALAAQYGNATGGFSTGANPHGYSHYGAWRGPVSELVYGELDGGFISLNFKRTAGR